MLTLLTRLRDILQPRSRRNLGLATAGSVVVAVLDSVGLVLVLPLVNVATGQADTTGAAAVVSSWLGNPSRTALTVVLTTAVVTLFVLKDIGSLVFAWWLNGFIFAERVRTSARILSSMLTAPYTVVASRSSAEMMRTADTAVLQVFTFTINGLMQTVASSISIVAILLGLSLVAPLPTLALAVYFGLAALAFDRIAKPRAARAGAVMNEASVRGFRTAFAALGAIKEVKLRGTQQHFVDNFRTAQLDGAYAGRTAGFIAALPKYVLEMLFIIAVGIVLALGSASNGNGAGAGATVGLLALFVGAGFRLLPAVSTLLASASSIRVGADALRVVHDEVSASGERSPEPAGGAAAPWGLTSSLELEGVCFSYPDGAHEVLRDVQLSVPCGSSIALVGASGAGKTTLVDLIVGLHSPSQGRVLADGRDIAGDLRAWQQSVAYVAQDVFLLEATLAENVAFDQPPELIDRAKVQRALAQSALSGVVDALPDGIDTPVGERGARLSGGQRQRIGLARALYRECSVLVLDEATSALDNETEHRISEALAALHGSVTVFVIAHRLSTVRHVDQVVFLAKGQVRCTGTFDEVRAVDVDFARLVELGSLDPAPSPDTSGVPE